MLELTHQHEVTKARQKIRREGQRLGFVPTMGALHSGHLALIERAKGQCDQVWVSVFVNPTQFNDPEDLKNYPQPLEQDLKLLKEAGVDAVFIPRADEIYKDQYRFQVSEAKDSLILCGRSRPGHFNGVLTVVLKLLQIVDPQFAYFGEKDYQQLKLIQDMVAAFFLSVEIVPCPTVREADGLAMSSRNRRLTPLDREKAALIKKALGLTLTSGRELLEQAGLRVDYFEEHWGRRFAAVYFDDVRLIDNVKI